VRVHIFCKPGSTPTQCCAAGSDGKVHFYEVNSGRRICVYRYEVHVVWLLVSVELAESLNPHAYSLSLSLSLSISCLFSTSVERMRRAREVYVGSTLHMVRGTF
jgi:hypothetical protein